MKYFPSSEALVNCLPCIYINIIASPHDYRFCCLHDGNFCLLKKNILQNIFISRAKLYSCSKGEANRHFMQWKANWVNAMWNKLIVNAMWNKLTVNAMWNKLKWNEMNKLTILQTRYPVCSTLKLSVLQPDNPNPLHWEDTHIHQLLLCQAPLRLWALGSSPARRVYAMWINLTTHAINNVNQINSQCFVNQTDSTIWYTDFSIVYMFPTFQLAHGKKAPSMISPFRAPPAAPIKLSDAWKYT